MSAMECASVVIGLLALASGVVIVLVLATQALAAGIESRGEGKKHG